MRTAALIVFLLGDALTFAYLMAADWPTLNAWNWLIVVPINLFLATIWPIYWGVLHWLFG